MFKGFEHIKMIVISLIFSALLTSANASSFEFVGDRGVETFSSWSYATKGVSLAISNNDIPYIAYSDGNQVLLTVKKLDGTLWVDVGTGGFVDMNNSYAQGTSILLDNLNTPYVIYRDNNLIPKLKKFDGNSWVNVLGDANISSMSGYTIGAQFYNDELYVVIDERTQVNEYTVSVKKLNGTNLEMVGSNLGSDKDYVQMVVHNENNIYVSYRDKVDNYKLKVQKYDGSSWTQIGTPLTDTTPNGHTIGCDNNGNLYIAYSYRDINYDNFFYIKKYDTVTSSWIALTDASLLNENLPSMLKQSSVLKFIFGTKSYFIGGNYDPYIYEFDGSALITLANSEAPKTGKFTASYDYAIDSSGIPYILGKDFDNAGQASLIKYNASSQSTTTNTTTTQDEDDDTTTTVVYDTDVDILIIDTQKTLDTNFTIPTINDINSRKKFVTNTGLGFNFDGSLSIGSQRLDNNTTVNITTEVLSDTNLSIVINTNGTSENNLSFDDNTSFIIKSAITDVNTSIESNGTVVVNSNNKKVQIESVNKEISHVVTNSTESSIGISEIVNTKTLLLEEKVQTISQPQVYAVDAGTKIEAIIDTATNGQTHTKFKITNLSTGAYTIQDTTDVSTPFESGNKVVIKEDGGLLKLETRTKITKEIVF
jgi:uncharacterized protein YuzE